MLHALVLALLLLAPVPQAQSGPPPGEDGLRAEVEARLAAESERAEEERSVELLDAGAALLEALARVGAVRTQAAKLSAERADLDERRARAQEYLASRPRPAVPETRPTTAELAALDTAAVAAADRLDALARERSSLQDERRTDLRERLAEAAQRADEARRRLQELPAPDALPEGSTEEERLVRRWRRRALELDLEHAQRLQDFLTAQTEALAPRLAVAELEVEAQRLRLDIVREELRLARGLEREALEREQAQAEAERAAAERESRRAESQAERRLQAWRAATKGLEAERAERRAELAGLLATTPIREAIEHADERAARLEDRYEKTVASGLGTGGMLQRALERVHADRVQVLGSADAGAWRERQRALALELAEAHEERFELAEEWEAEVARARAEWLAEQPPGATLERWQTEELVRWEELRRERSEELRGLTEILGELQDSYLTRLQRLVELGGLLDREQRWIEHRSLRVRSPLPDAVRGARLALRHARLEWDALGRPVAPLVVPLLLVALVAVVTAPLRRRVQARIAALPGGEAGAARRAWLAIAARGRWALVPLLIGWSLAQALPPGGLRDAAWEVGLLGAGALLLSAMAHGLLELASDAGAALRVGILVRVALLVTFLFGLPYKALVSVRYQARNPDLVALLGVCFRGGLAVCVFLALISGRRLLALLPERVRERFESRFGLFRLVVLAGLVATVAVDVVGYHQLAEQLLSILLGSFITLTLGWAALNSALRVLGRLGAQRTEDDELGARRRAFALAQGRVGVKVVLALAVAWGLALSFGLDAGVLSDLAAVRLWPLGAPTRGDWELTLGSLVAGALALIFAFLLGALLRGLLDLLLLSWMGVERGLRYSISSVVYYLVLTVGGFMALSTLGLALQDLKWFLAAAGVGIGFGLQEIVSNFVSGVIILFERPIKVGDVIGVEGREGEVVDVSIRATTVRTWDNLFVLVPNKELITQRLTNFTGNDPRVRVHFRIGVAYGSDLKLVRDVLIDCGTRHGLVLKSPEPFVFFVGHGESSLDFELRCWCHIDDRLAVTSDVRFAIDAAFRRNGIQIPFPQRDLHVKGWPPRPAPEPRAESAGRLPDSPGRADGEARG